MSGTAPFVAQGDKRGRNRTDQSLADERAKANDAIDSGKTSIETRADEVVQQARQAADDVLEVAREKAHATLELASDEARGTLERGRVEASDALQVVRAAEDETLDRERMERKLLLESLLGAERAATDRHLLLEREWSDASLASRDEFLELVTHELRSMITAVALAAQHIRRQVPAHETEGLVAKMSARIQQMTPRMSRLVGELIDVVSIEAGRLRMAARTEDVIPLVLEAVEAAQPLATARGIAVRADISGSALLARFDNGRILQVLANLLNNALAFTPAGGQVTVRAEAADGNLVQLTVSDTGPGIPSARLDEIFDRFWEVGQKKRPALSLGLSISRSIVESHGGRLWVVSEDGKGSTFFFTLPAGGSGE